MRVLRRPRVVYVSTYPPRRCGLATFTRDLVEAGESTGLLAPPAVVAVSDAAGEYSYDSRVALEISQHQRTDYAAAARYINQLDADVVNLQHEYGIYGGEDGSDVIDLVRGLRKPLVITLHTVLSQPEPRKVRIIRELAGRSQVLVVMARRAVELLTSVYGIRREKIVIIPHGAPAAPGVPREEIRRHLGLADRLVLCTLGLINPGKGIEYVLEALPSVVARHPSTLYLVLGQTHPGVRRAMGEAYRDRLLGMVDSLGLQRHVRFVDSYLSQADLVQYLVATDVYVTPYTGRDQITSGTLAYAVALGKAVVSTPYAYAEELLGGGGGLLVDFYDSSGISAAVNRLAAEPDLRADLEARAARTGRDMAWPQVARQFARVFLETVFPASQARARSSGRAHRVMRSLPADPVAQNRSRLFRTGPRNAPYDDTPRAVRGSDAGG